MSVLAILIPVTLCMGAIGLVVFFWTMRSGQYNDLSGDAERILFDDDVPLPDHPTKTHKETTP